MKEVKKTMFAIALFGAHVSEEALHGMEHSVTLVCRLISVGYFVRVSINSAAVLLLLCTVWEGRGEE